MKTVVLLTVIATATLAEAGDPRGARAILQRLDRLVGARASRACAAKAVTYPPDVVVLRAFKQEEELEIWAANEGMDELRLVLTLPICAVETGAGPKLKPYDKKTPEGFFTLAERYRSKLPWMWVKLDPGSIDDFGVVGDGSPFFLHLSYPNAVDAAHSTAAGFRVPRGEICMHANCATEGCVSFENRDFLTVFAFAVHHDESRYGEVQLHVLPFRFDRAWTAARASRGYKHRRALGTDHLQRFWENLEQGVDRFDAHPWPLPLAFGVVVLRPGDSSPDVLRIKAALRDRGLFDGDLDPEYGSDLVAAVDAFQASTDIAEEGIGPATWGALGFDWKTRYLLD